MPPVQAAPIDHYENFPVASWLCPAHLRFAVSAVYHFARTADDLADEGDLSSVQRVEALSEYRADLNACLSLVAMEPHTLGHKPISKRWPHIFTPLQSALAEFNIPPELLHLLLDAFEQDVLYSEARLRYKNREELLKYCYKSAAPIGRIMLHLFEHHEPDSLIQSDAICCALQLINFWQDISIDVKRNRFYLPLDTDLLTEINFAQTLMQSAAPLCLTIKGRAGWELRAVVQGGLRIIEKLKRRDPLKSRPQLRRLDYALIAWRCLFKKSFMPVQNLKTIFPTVSK